MNFTKTSILLSFLIVALGVAISWQDHRQLASARANQSELAVKLAAAGNRVDLSQAGNNVEITKRQRDKKEGDHHESTSGMAAIIRKITADFKNSDNSGPASSAKLQSLEDLKSRIVLWTKQDPTSAVAWIRENHVIFSGSVEGHGALREMLSTVGMKDPALAFQLIGELKVESPNKLISHMAMFAETAESRTATFAALRRYVSTMPAGEERDQALNVGVEHLILGSGLQGFEAGAEWINHAGIMPEQFAFMFDKMAAKGGGFESDKRLFDLLIPRLPPEKVAGSVSKLVTSWAKQDYKSVGEWISGQANGVVKNAGIGAYSQAVAAYEPAVAVQWAMTLPPSKDRETALQGVYENWLKTDPGGKEAFGKQHGLE